MITDRTLLVWDRDEKLPSNHNDVVFWRSNNDSESERIFSLPRLVEENADRLRSKYLALIYDLGESKIKGRRIVDHLELRPGFSYWWMTLLTEKCNFAKSPQIDHVIKLLAFQELLVGKDYIHILMVSSNAALAKTMRLLAFNLEIDFTWQKVSLISNKKKLTRRIYHRLSYSLQAIMWLTYKLITNWSLKGVGVDEWKKTKAKITFVSYLFNLVPESAMMGKYDSRYWTVLPDLLSENRKGTNWLHIYVEDSLLPSATKARDLIKQFNHSYSGSQVHVTLYSFLGFGLIFRVIRDWYKVFKLNNEVCKHLQAEIGYLWPLFKKDCQISMSGTALMSNLLYLHLFEKAMSDLPTQDRGCYLQENQGWEFGFIYAWQAARHGNYLIGLPHGTVRYWDLRYFFDPRNYERTGNCDLPLPDFIGTNGCVSKQMYLGGYYPEDMLLEVEALRYLYLADIFNKKLVSKNESTKNAVVLILGGYVLEDTVKLMKLVNAAAHLLNESIKFIVKPHPACPIQAEDYPNLQMEVTMNPIPKLLGKCDLVYTSSQTSAAVEAYCAGKSVVTVLNQNALNLSPLRGRKEVLFITNPEELADVLNGNNQMQNIEGQGKDYFFLDPNLPRWKKLINLQESTP